jgi:two-component sensor histidine kinase
MIILDNQIEPLKLDVDSVIPMGLIVNELMSNALKYAFPENRDGKIAVLLKEQGASLLLQVSDNGIGMKEQQINSNSESFGYTLIRAFKNKLDAKIDIQSEGGTVVSLVINNYKKVV